MPSSRIAALLARPCAVLDGAWGTQLQARGLPPGACPDAWNLARPAEVEAVARAYVEAGAHAVLTNTFGANRLALAGHGESARAAAIARAGAVLSRRAAGDGVAVIASVGPSGALLAAGEGDPVALAEAFAEQAAALVEGGADGAVVETMADPAEAAIAVRACVAAGLWTCASFTFDSGRAKDRTLHGATPERAAEAALAAGAHAVGCNCGLGAGEAAPIVERLARAAGGRPVWAKPNRGLPDAAGRYAVEAATFAARAAALRDAGARLIGGCCGSDPACIRALAARVG